MALVWKVECKTCLQQFAVLPREATEGKSTDALVAKADVGAFECAHCHEIHHYGTQDFIPGEGKIHR